MQRFIRRRGASGGAFALGRGGDVHFFAVFGNRAAGAVDALLFEQVGNLAVGQGFGGVFAFDELPDERAHGAVSKSRGSAQAAVRSAISSATSITTP